MTSSYRDITWRELPGNKFNLALRPAMPTEQGHYTTQKVKQAYRKSEVCRVHYDRDYVVAFLASKVIRPLGVHGKLELIDLISNAWDLYYPKVAEESEAV